MIDLIKATFVVAINFAKWIFMVLISFPFNIFVIFLLITIACRMFFVKKRIK